MICDNISYVVVYLEVQLNVQYGKAVYVVGNRSQFGNWNMCNAYRLNWHEGHLWKGSVLLQLSEEPVEYKYVIADYFLIDENSKTVWESGANRVLLLQDSEGEIHINQKFNKQTIRLELETFLENFSYNVVLKGYRGGVEIQKAMNKIANSDCHLWTITLEVQKQKEYIQYYYTRVKDSEALKQRGLRLLSLVNIRLNKSYRFLPGQILIKDNDPFTQFQVSRITDGLLLGAYVRSQHEILYLRQQGVRAVINLQSSEDLLQYEVDLEELNRKYQQSEIHLYNIPITDMKVSDFVRKSYKALQCLTEALDKHQVVYVHCNAGVYRSPQLVVLYLICYQGFNLREAVDLVQSNRKIAKPNVKCIELSLTRILNKVIKIQEVKRDNQDKFQQQPVN